MHPRPLLFLVSFLALSAIAISTPARADLYTGSNAAYLDLSPQADAYFPGPCDIWVTGSNTRIYVRAISIPFQKVRLTIPDVPGVTVVNESWGVSFTGNHATGVEVDMGSCIGPIDRLAPVVVGYVDVAWGTLSDCTTWEIAGNAEVQDCDGLWRPVYEVQHRLAVTTGCGQCLWQLCYWPLAAYDPEPANGATNVPLDAVLKWKFTHEPDWPQSYVRITTRPDGTLGGEYWCHDLYEYAPDFLEPGRTYYWQARWGDCCQGGCQDTNGFAWGPVYSFTTEGVLPVEGTTWGHVKALYRN